MSMAQTRGLARRGNAEQSDFMLTAFVCLWIGFALGFVCAAMLRSGRGEAADGIEETRRVPARTRLL